MSDGVARLCGAATLPEHRRHGVQSALPSHPGAGIVGAIRLLGDETSQSRHPLPELVLGADDRFRPLFLEKLPGVLTVEFVEGGHRLFTAGGS